MCGCYDPIFIPVDGSNALSLCDSHHRTEEMEEKDKASTEPKHELILRWPAFTVGMVQAVLLVQLILVTRYWGISLAIESPFCFSLACLAYELQVIYSFFTAGTYLSSKGYHRFLDF